MSEKGGQGIYRRGDGSWRIVVAAGRDPESGKYVQVRETLKGTKRDAVRRRDELRAQVGRGTVASGGTETVAVFLARHIDHREAIGKIRPKTASVYRGYVRREIAPRIGILRLTEVRPVHVQRVLDDALASGLSARSVLQVHRIMHAAFRQAIRWQMLAMNPSDGVTPPKAETPDLTTPTAEQISDLLDAVSDAFRPAIAVLAGTGLRRGEVAALRWEGVDLDSARPSLIVSGSMQRADGALRVFPPKTARGHRVVPLPETVAAILRRVRSEQNERRLLAGAAWAGEGFVFDRGDGRPIDPDILTKAFCDARQRSGVAAGRLHDLRHHFGTLHMANGTNPRVVSDLLGHSSVSFTMMTYSHPAHEVAVEAMRAVDASLGEALDGR